MTYVPGPFVAPHLYLQWGGTLPGNETWSCGLRLSEINTGPWPDTDAAAMLPAVATAIEAFHARPASMISAFCNLTFVKLNPINVSGHYDLPTTNELVIAPESGGSSTNLYPNQVALVASLVTAVTRGPAHAGRIYLPMPTAALGTDGEISSGDRDTIKGSLNTLLTQLNAVRSTYAVAVHSRKAGAPAQRIVTGWKVGRVLDTQRRRRKSLVENY
jgi:hypothetical protein